MGCYPKIARLLVGLPYGGRGLPVRLPFTRVTPSYRCVIARWSSELYVPARLVRCHLMVETGK